MAIDAKRLSIIELDCHLQSFAMPSNVTRDWSHGVARSSYVRGLNTGIEQQDEDIEFSLGHSFWGISQLRCKSVLEAVKAFSNMDGQDAVALAGIWPALRFVSMVGLEIQPSASSKKLSALRNYLKVAPDVLPENRATHASVLWHGDLHLQNVFVDPAEPTQIVGVIDCRRAKKLHQAQTLHNLYLALSRQNNPTAFQAIKGQDSLRHQVEKEWSAIVGKGLDNLPLISCPLRFSAAEMEQQEHDEKLWAQGVDLMSDFINETGCFKHWDGRVSREDYAISKRQLAAGVERFLGRKARSQEERKAWLKALPFVD
ncbi:hypothetical protein I7I51_02792 [Histoplasma capsulatum]|uniref:Aminoglycoside phosphotransferase domain-containing protein n=1 Tax=Ajellomyces capsulatus TaxID=5037 RepID=A0A8A1MPR1_AJECA|nr:hypothetical protein I7I51_02792 [Histoplasma capsulatum]